VASSTSGPTPSAPPAAAAPAAAATPTEGIAPSDPPEVDLAQVAAAPARIETDQVPTRSFTTVGVRVPRAASGPVLVRWQGRAGWSDWHELEVDTDVGPDQGSDEAQRATTGAVETEPLWVGEATAYQVNLPHDAVADDAAAPAPEVLLVRPHGGHLVAQAEAPPAGAATLNQPPIHGRSEWGARPPSSSIPAASELKMAVVHHSDTGNAYTQAEVPAVLRSIQAYHMGGRGWSDIGYNLVVDRFGGIWEGRDGSVDRLSIGAHSMGFNTSTVGVMVLGNYAQGAPTGAALDGVAEVIAWKFANEGVDPASSVQYTSAGSLSIPAGVTRTFPRIVGHRDVGATACPGAYLYARLGDVRGLVAAKFPAKSSPGGIVDTVSGGPTSLLVSGWALDPSAPDPIQVHVYVDGVGTNLGPAANPRPDIGAGFPRAGPRHGFSHVFSGVSPGPHQVCVFAINVGPGSNTLLTCRTAVVPTGSPVGVLDTVRLGPDGLLSVSGWALDPDTSDPIPVHVYVDGVGTNLGPTSVPRPDLGGPYPLYGARHGFSWSRQVTRARHAVCVFAIDAGPGSNTLLGCRDVIPPTGSPVGVLDAAAGGPDGRYGLFGWALDPDVADPIAVHVYVDGVGRNLGPTSGDRPDIAAAYPGYGARHGYATTGAGLAPGRHRACADAINVGPGGNVQLGCRDFVVPGGSPFGSIDGVTAASGHRVQVAGWAIDPDTASPIPVHVYIDGAGHDLGPTSADRPDVAAAFAGYGARHGVRWTSGALTPGSHQVCVFAIDTGVGDNALLGCRTVSV
jgi:hypothetical protein